jgi:hypothetical protein
MRSTQERYSEPKKSQQEEVAENRLFFCYVGQKSVNARQIIPVFTIVWDDG